MSESGDLSLIEDVDPEEFTIKQYLFRIVLLLDLIDTRLIEVEDHLRRLNA